MGFLTSEWQQEPELVLLIERLGAQMSQARLELATQPSYLDQGLDYSFYDFLQGAFWGSMGAKKWYHFAFFGIRGTSFIFPNLSEKTDDHKSNWPWSLGKEKKII